MDPHKTWKSPKINDSRRSCDKRNSVDAMPWHETIARPPQGRHSLGIYQFSLSQLCIRKVITILSHSVTTPWLLLVKQNKTPIAVNKNQWVTKDHSRWFQKRKAAHTSCFILCISWAQLWCSSFAPAILVANSYYFQDIYAAPRERGIPEKCSKPAL